MMLRAETAAVRDHDRAPGERAARAGWPRWQPPAHSPLSLAALMRAGRDALFPGAADPRDRVRLMLADAYAARQVELTGSGTQALTLAIRHAFDVAESDVPSIVALPAYSCYDVATAAVGSGLSIALYDVDPDTLSPDLDSLQRLLHAGVRVVVVAHLYGYPVDWDSLQALAATYGATLIEDAAQGHGGRWQSGPLGSLGSTSVLSFGRGKGWTGSRGGAVLERRTPRLSESELTGPSVGDELKTLLTGLAQWGLSRPAWYWLPASLPWLRLGETDYHEPGPCFQMTRAAARAIEETRPLAMAESFTRRCNAWEMLGRLPESRFLIPILPHSPAQPGFLRLPLRIAGGAGSLADLAGAARLGVGGSYPTTLAVLPAVRDRLVGSASTWPGAETLVREIVTLPTHSGLGRDDRNRLVSLFERYAMRRAVSVPLTLKA